MWLTQHLRKTQSTSVHIWLIVQAARHTELLEDFSDQQPGFITGHRETEGKEELNLILQVVDILDELNILMFLFEKQTGVVSEVQRKCSSETPREMQQNHEPSRTVYVDNNVGNITINTASFQPLGDVNLEATSQLLGGYAGRLMGQAKERLQAEKADTERLHGEVAQTHKLVSFIASEFIRLRRVAYSSADSS